MLHKGVLWQLWPGHFVLCCTACDKLFYSTPLSLHPEVHLWGTLYTVGSTRRWNSMATVHWSSWYNTIQPASLLQALNQGILKVNQYWLLVLELAHFCQVLMQCCYQLSRWECEVDVDGADHLKRWHFVFVHEKCVFVWSMSCYYVWGWESLLNYLHVRIYACSQECTQTSMIITRMLILPHATFWIMQILWHKKKEISVPKFKMENVSAFLVCFFLTVLFSSALFLKTYVWFLFSSSSP